MSQAMLVCKRRTQGQQVSCCSCGQRNCEVPWCFCRLVNRSGLRLSYWTDEAGQDGEVGCAYALNAWEESPLLVDPVERTVIIPDTQQQVSYSSIASTGCMGMVAVSD